MDFKQVSSDELYKIYLDKNLDSGGLSISFNMVASLDGVTTIKGKDDVSASERGLGNPVDQKILHILRIHADCVLNGSTTLRISGSSSKLEDSELVEARKAKGKEMPALDAVLSTKAEFEDQVLQHAFFKDPSFDSVLFVNDDAPEENLEKVREASSNKHLTIEKVSKENTIQDVVDRLSSKYNVKNLHVEGGSTVNGAFIKAGYGDHFFLSEVGILAIQSPSSKNAVSGPETLVREELRGLKLESAYYVEEVSTIFQHWKFV